MRPTSGTLLMPIATSGVLMAAYLLLRPYGDHGSATTPEAAEAFANTWWVVAHLAGALALVQFSRAALRLHDVLPSTTSMVARWSGLAGAVLVLPYFGAETFGLHAIGRAGLTDPSVLGLVDEVRNQPVALATFALGLVLLAVSGLAAAAVWQRASSAGLLPGPAWALWPLGVAVALVLPQFFLPPAGRMAFGIAYLAAAAVFVIARIRASRLGGAEEPAGVEVSVVGH